MTGLDEISSAIGKGAFGHTGMGSCVGFWDPAIGASLAVWVNGVADTLESDEYRRAGLACAIEGLYEGLEIVGIQL